MNAWLLALLLPTATFSYGQTGMHPLAANHPKAGDVAPGITFTKVLSSPGSAPWNPTSFSGQMMVLAFYPNTSANVQSVTQWNDVVDQFADKPIQFVWITGEAESTVIPWLRDHPVKGWVLHDPGGSTEKLYGLEFADSVFVGADQRIIGFSLMLQPEQVKAVLEGRITTTPPTRTTMKAFNESNRVLLGSEPTRMRPLEETRPQFPPSSMLRVSPSQGDERGNFGGPDFVVLKGYRLKEAIQELYGVNPIRVHLPASLDNNKSYDFALLLPEPEGQEDMRGRVRRGIESHFHIVAAHEKRLSDVYVVTSTGRKPPLAKAQAEGESLASSMSSMSVAFETSAEQDPTDLKPVNIAGLRGIQTEGTADQFCQVLEGALDRPVVNETDLQGEFEFSAESSEGAENDFLDRVRDQLGLIISPAKRNVDVLVFHTR